MKTILYIFIFILFLNIGNLSAQINISGKPISFENKTLLENTNIPVFEFLELNNEQLTIEAEQNGSKEQPWQFGLNREVNINLKTGSLIITLDSGKLYRLIVYSKNALTLNFRFDTYKIPDGAVLYIYNEQRTDLLGGFTSQNNQPDGIFATSLIKGDKIVLEYFEPDHAEFEGELILSQVTHGFRSISDYSKSFGQSGECNMNVACPDALDWPNEIRSVCMLVVGGSALCSGSLINNTLSDGTPYILTADHCYTNPSSLVFMFNWESETCDNPSVAPSHQDLSGAILIARNEDSDFFLMKMNNTPPYNYNVFYSGWYKENAIPTSSVCIHHPRGDIKKISFDDHQAVSDYYLGSSNPPDSHWKVIWDRNTTTEGGSSGSPLFNQNHRIIGQLHGGMASCDNLNAPDWYGKFSYSWDMGATPETRLKEWLDPINNGITDMPGYDPNIPVYDIDVQLLSINSPSDNIFDGSEITPSFKVRNIGNDVLTSFTMNYSINEDLNNDYHWTGNLNSGEIIDIEMNPITIPSGKYELLTYVSDPNGSEDEFHYNDTIRRQIIVYQAIFEDDFEKGKFWYLTGEFEIDKPEGLGGETGFPDPDKAYSGKFVLGTDLTGLGQYHGDYEDGIGFYEEYALSPVVDCRNFENVVLKYERYLGIDRKNNDNASIELFDGENWNIIWSNSIIPIEETNWTEQIIDISEYGDGKNINIKYLLGPTDQSEQFCGWNIDDFKLLGTLKKDVISESEGVKIYPNPAKHYFYVQFKGDEFETVLVSISDITGKLRFEKSYSENEMIKTGINHDQNLLFIDYPNSDKGLFLIEIKTDKASYSNKVILY